MAFDRDDPLAEASLKQSQRIYPSANNQINGDGNDDGMPSQVISGDDSINQYSQKMRLREQSVIDPDKGSILMNYGLDDFKNSIWENFLGSQVQLSCTVDPDGTETITNQNIDKLGPIQLRIDEGNLYQAWERSRRSEVEGFRGDIEGQTKVLETWVCRPPNIMLFQLNRVNFDIQKQKLVKDNSRFDFDKTIYLDLFLNQNKEKSKAHRKQIEKLKKSLKQLKDVLDQYTENYNVAQKFQECHEILSKSIQKEQAVIQNKVSVGIQQEGQDEEEFVYLTPNQLHHTNMNL